MIRRYIFIYTLLTALEIPSKVPRELGQTSFRKLSVHYKNDKRQYTLQWTLFNVNWEELHVEMMYSLVSERYSIKCIKNLASLCAHLWYASLMATGVQHKDNVDAIQKTGMQTNSFFNWQFSTKPCKRANATFNNHVLVSKALKLACEHVQFSSSTKLTHEGSLQIPTSPETLY